MVNLTPSICQLVVRSFYCVSCMCNMSVCHIHAFCQNG